MEELDGFLQVFAEGGGNEGCFSVPQNKDSLYQRCKVTLTSHKGTVCYQLEQFSQKQAFHKNVPLEEIVAILKHMLLEEYQQFTYVAEGKRYSLKRTKKGKILYHYTKNTQETIGVKPHNREKQYLLPQDIAIPPLVDLGILTKEGKVVQSMYHKYRQINRFLELVEDVVKQLGDQPLHIVDFGCGKSYLTFVVYHYLTQICGRSVEMVGMDLKSDVIANCNRLAKKYGYEGLQFVAGDIADYVPQKPIDMVIALHACDQATDYALYHGVRMKSKAILSAPCCQHQLNSQADAPTSNLMLRYGIIQERFCALATDAIRGNLLEMMGYKTQLLEFVELEHSPKNILIRSVRKGKEDKKKEPYYSEVINLCKEFSFRPKLAELFEIEW